MGKTNNIQPETLVRYLSGESTPEERKDVDHWRSHSVSNEQVFREYKQIWEADHHTLLSGNEIVRDWDKIRSRIRFEKQDHRPAVLSSLFRIAAVFLLMLAVSAALYTYWNVPGFGRWSAFQTEDQID
ncbi:MAG: FecR family protein, partial [Bacteroidota bacterium]